MSVTQEQLITDSFKEAVPDRRTQPGLEAVYPQGLGYGYPVEQSLQVVQPVPVPGVGKRKLLWLFIAVGVLAAAVIGLAVGLGVGLTQQKASSASSESSAAPDSLNNTTSSSLSSPSPSPSSSSSPTTGTGTETTTTLSSLPTPTSAPTSICPGANNTIVTQRTGSQRYRIYCDSDWGGSGKKTLASVVLGSFGECLSLCNTMNYFQERSDIGCTYNVAGTGTQTPGTCWCLGGEGVVVTENVGNEAAMPISG